MRVIARRVFLDKLRLPGLHGRGTLDAKLQLRDGRVDAARWQASARELQINGEQGARFDHVTVNGTLDATRMATCCSISPTCSSRAARASNARRTSRAACARARHACASRAPPCAPNACRSWPPNSSRACSAPGPRRRCRRVPAWTPLAGELHELRFDSGDARKTPDAWTFSARMSGADFTRAADQARIAQLAAHLRMDARSLT